MQNVCKHEVPKGFTLGAHGVPEEQPAYPGQTQAEQVVRVQAFCVLGLVHVHQLGHEGQSLQKHGERDEHLESEEKLALFARVEDPSQNHAYSDEHIPL